MRPAESAGEPDATQREASDASQTGSEGFKYFEGHRVADGPMGQSMELEMMTSRKIGSGPGCEENDQMTVAEMMKAMAENYAASQIPANAAFKMADRHANDWIRKAAREGGL